ncbi:hypothetical protein SynBIOSE41_00923 [Synechococcus sp. BIOS-E4-1]|nr:hypothetical protein SynBIOSE41_00923 [Synechococcus sp. BIOS-E4-1]
MQSISSRRLQLKTLTLQTSEELQTAVWEFQAKKIMLQRFRTGSSKNRRIKLERMTL